MVIHVQAINNLTPEDYILIQNEHAAIERYIADLRDTCCNLENNLGCSSCSREKWGSCTGRLPSFLYDLIALVGRHFAHEETIMLSRPHVSDEYEYFRIHREAHSNLMQQLRVTVDECTRFEQGRTAESYRHLYNRILQLFEEHDNTFDDPFIQSVLK